MINFIIYEEVKCYVEVISDVIHRFMVNNDNHYRIYYYSKCNEKDLQKIISLTGENIYILDVETNNNDGLNLAYKIRKMTNLMNNQIILLTPYNDLVVNAYHRRLLMFDFLLKCDDLEKNLYNCIGEIFLLFNQNKALTIKINGEIYRILHKDILYIEKKKNENYLCIHTNDGEYNYHSNITEVENNLKYDIRFVRSHRSAIVNVNKITKIDMINNVIYFDEIKMNYLSREHKKELERELHNNKDLY